MPCRTALFIILFLLKKIKSNLEILFVVGKTDGEGSRVLLEQLSAELRRASVTYISPKTYFPEFTIARMYIWPKVHFPENLFSRIYTCQNVHLAEITFPRKLIFQILYTLNRNFVIDRIYITKICHYACSFSKIIKLRVE